MYLGSGLGLTWGSRTEWESNQVGVETYVWRELMGPTQKLDRPANAPCTALYGWWLGSKVNHV